MSKIIAITVCHAPSRIIGHGLKKFYDTCGREPDKHILVQNHWPLHPKETAQSVWDFGTYFKCEVIEPDKNLGGHGGVNFALKYAKPDPEDLILIYDPDSNPVNNGWLKAMSDVLHDDPRFAYVALQHTHHPKQWKLVTCAAGHMVGMKPIADEFNISMWWADFLRDGLKAQFEFYGQVENPMFIKARQQGMTMGYLMGFFETHCPIQPPQVYIDWKRDHVSNQYPGNFDQYVKERTENEQANQNCV